jgi:hypothetical protein
VVSCLSEYESLSVFMSLMTDPFLVKNDNKRWAAEPDGTQSGLSTFEQTSERPTLFHLSHEQPLSLLSQSFRLLRREVL